MCIEISKLIRKNVSVRHKVEVLLAKPFLHSYDIIAKSVLSCNFVALRKVIDLLIFVKSFIDVRLATTGTPKNIPLMWLGMSKSVRFKHRSDQFIVEAKHFVKKFAVFNMVRFLIPLELLSVRYHLIFLDVLECDVFIFFCPLVLGRRRIELRPCWLRIWWEKSAWRCRRCDSFVEGSGWILRISSETSLLF